MKFENDLKGITKEQWYIALKFGVPLALLTLFIIFGVINKPQQTPQSSYITSNSKPGSKDYIQGKLNSENYKSAIHERLSRITDNYNAQVTELGDASDSYGHYRFKVSFDTKSLNGISEHYDSGIIEGYIHKNDFGEWVVEDNLVVGANLGK